MDILDWWPSKIPDQNQMVKGLVGEEFGGCWDILTWTGLVVKFGENRKIDIVRFAMGEGLDANEKNGRGTLVWRQNLWNSNLGEPEHLLKIGFFDNFFQHQTFMGKIRIFRKGLRLRLCKSKQFLWKINMGRQKNNVWRAVVQVWEQVPENG